MIRKAFGPGRTKSLQDHEAPGAAAQARAALEQMLALPLLAALLQARRAPDRHPPLQIRLDLQVGAKRTADLQFECVIAAVSRQRRERVERAPLVEVDKAERPAARVAESHDRAEQHRAKAAK